ncbi:U-box domain-containing protein 8 [Hibiscus syriacus]|uniref:RING-type E3 ubiquitin transferase n=1 Tax=Hibiscus syriacus TaxID=106335 RepID=A0A6A2XB01_HIBSY|nr:U-box domain-containing protein 8 [Hibiscus syriacus]
MTTQLPDDFKCPISLEIMSDPVTLPSGHTFDRLSIQRLAFSPKPSYLFWPLHRPPIETKLNSLTQLARLTKHDSGLRRKLTEWGAAPAVLRCVDSDDLNLQEKALSLLLNLSLDDDKVGLVAEGAINRVVKVLRLGSPDCRAIAATIITSLAVVEVNKATIGAYPDAIQALVGF